jgi:hypothetical protein
MFTPWWRLHSVEHMSREGLVAFCNWGNEINDGNLEYKHNIHNIS